MGRYLRECTNLNLAVLFISCLHILFTVFIEPFQWWQISSIYGALPTPAPGARSAPYCLRPSLFFGHVAPCFPISIHLADHGIQHSLSCMRVLCAPSFEWYLSFSVLGFQVLIYLKIFSFMHHFPIRTRLGNGPMRSNLCAFPKIWLFPKYEVISRY